MISGALEALQVVQRRAFVVDRLRLRIGADQIVQIAALELVGVAGQGA
jgi:hypothetical protein